MEGPFRSSRFDKLLVQSGRLLTDAAEQERMLADLVARLDTSNELLPAVRRLSATARLQRERAEALHAGLIGDQAGTSYPDRPVVLVVDDSKDGLETVALFLELSGFHAITAENGLEALI